MTMTDTPAPTDGGRAAAKKGAPAKGKKGKGAKGAKGEKKSFLKSKKGIIAIVALLAVGGVGYKMMAPAGAEKPVGGEVVPLDATTLNLQGNHYLKIAIAVQLAEGKGTADAFKGSQASELLIDEFSDRTVASVSTNAARTKLMGELETKIKKAYDDGEVFKVFVTQFVTQ